jgi:transposase-like protein
VKDILITYVDNLSGFSEAIAAVYPQTDVQKCIVHQLRNSFKHVSYKGRSNWTELTAFFQYPEELRKIIYTTNVIESYNRQLRKVTKGKSIFPNDEALLKMLYLSTMDVMKKWTGRVQG